MKYLESEIDRQLRQRFINDHSHASLREIWLQKGNLRGINSLEIKFDYPITVIAGKNGVGKSTILALACCAYHNKRSGFKLPKRKTSYYTFSDFFVQHTNEAAPQGIKIFYGISYNNWSKTSKKPERIGIGYQTRHKEQKGRWNDYATRVNRNVAFLGIERIVPHSERSQSRSYSKAFRDTALMGWEDKVKEAVGHIVGKSYDDFRYLRYSKYSLPIVKVGDVIYTGFNMGAGENALFEIFSTIYSCGHGALLVLDEIELGLHAEAQRKFIIKLKHVCLETHTQVICTTHSKEILNCLPYEARYFVENVRGKTTISKGISSDFAFSKMNGLPTSELELMVEDRVAETLIKAILPAQVRVRVTITTIGSSTALARQLGAAYVRNSKQSVIAVFDGDQRSCHADNKNCAKGQLESNKEKFPDWYDLRCTYLPGDTWPEAWILQKSRAHIKEIACKLNTTPENLTDILDSALRAKKHEEFREISNLVGLEEETCLQFFCSTIGPIIGHECSELLDKINSFLNHSH